MFDQIFVELKHWIVGNFPAGWQPLVSIWLSILPIMMVFPFLFALTTILERKGLGRIQNRRGPNRVGPCGLFQPIADGIKMLTKEDIVPRASDKAVHFLAPIALVVPVFLAFSVLPFGREMVAIDLDAGILFFFAVGAATELAVFMGGWGSRNKYSLLGGMRAVAQMISYEVPLILSTVTVIMAVGSMSLVTIVEAQGGVLGWHVFTPWGLAGFVLFIIAAMAESNRSPFDIPEGESELVAGYFTEYSGFKFALFFLGEYLGLFAVTGLAITLFLGGWQAPFPFLEFIPSYLWFFLKFGVILAVFIWIRGTMPRLRMDQLLHLAWKFMVPLTLMNIVVAAIWVFMPAGVLRWAVCAALVVGAYLLLGRMQTGYERRTYRFAE